MRRPLAAVLVVLSFVVAAAGFADRSSSDREEALELVHEHHAELRALYRQNAPLDVIRSATAECEARVQPIVEQLDEEDLALFKEEVDASAARLWGP